MTIIGAVASVEWRHFALGGKDNEETFIRDFGALFGA